MRNHFILASKPIIFILFLTALLYSCNLAKQKAKETIHATGETVGKGSSEFFNGVAEGVDQTFECKLELSQNLKDKGMQLGKFKIINSGDSSRELLTAYLIFDQDFRQKLSVKVFDHNGLEYGRTNVEVDGKKGEAKYIDFPFDNRTEIESKSKFVIQ